MSVLVSWVECEYDLSRCRACSVRWTAAPSLDDVAMVLAPHHALHHAHPVRADDVWVAVFDRQEAVNDEEF